LERWGGLEICYFQASPASLVYQASFHMIQFDILTLFPEIIYQYSKESILGRALKKQVIKICAHNFREDTKDKHARVDDRPYGGGAGMILQVQPIFDCLRKIQAWKARKDGKAWKILKNPPKKQKIILLDPAGKKFDQRMAEKFAKLDRIVLICGRYEGFDARIHKLIDERVSIGDYVLAGGELPALTIVEAVSRLIPGVLGNEESLKQETHNDKNSKTKIENVDLNNSKEYPQYTRPENFMGWKVPKVLLSGDHKKILEWRNKYFK
jgi:tRNA (guanine37-N1)-methyltransferase